jgi:tetratricopeptide (TPR) repeat protein
MRFRSGMTFAFGAALLLGGCAAGAAGVGGTGPVTSPTGRVYEEGTRPTNSRFTAPAILLLAQEQYQQALVQAQQGIAADEGNPQHYFIAGQAYLGLNNVDEALRMFERAEQIYPAYELEIEPVREQAWAVAFNEGVNAYNDGDMEVATAAWQRANRIFPLRPEAFLNLAVIHTQQAEYDAAIQAYRQGLAALERQPAARVLTPEDIEEREESRGLMVANLAQLLNYTEQYAEAEQLYRQQLQASPNNVEIQSSLAVAIARQGRAAEAQAIYNRLLGDPNLGGTDLFNVGVALFQGENYEQSAEAFRRYTEIQPNSRDGWYNFANALYAQNAWRPLVDVATRLVQLDPLNENSALILARAHRETGQNQRALQALQANEAHPVHIEDLEFRPAQQRAVVRGRVAGASASPGTPVQLRFTFYGEGGATVGTQTGTGTAPARGQSTTFEAVHEGAQQAVTYRYELVR